MKKLLILPVLFLLLSCSTIKVNYDYDKDANFSKYKTYAFTDESLNIKLDELNRDRLIKSIENELATKGFSKSSEPDVFVDVIVKGQEVVTANATTTGFGYGGGYYSYGYGVGYSNTQVSYDKYIEGTLIIIMIDRATNKVIWQGTGVKEVDQDLNPADREYAINSVVKDIMANYPPAAKK